MYKSVFLDTRVELTASELSDIRSAEGLRDTLVKKIKRVEGKCNANGYVKPGSVQLLARSMGAAENGKFTGNWVYNCKYTCMVLKPVAYDPKEVDAEASVLSARVLKVNKMGAYAAFEEAVRILLPRDYHAGDAAFDALKEGDIIRVRMEKHRFQTDDDYIMGVGTLYKPTTALAEGGEAEAAVSVLPSTEEEEEEEAAAAPEWTGGGVVESKEDLA